MLSYFSFSEEALLMMRRIFLLQFLIPFLLPAALLAATFSVDIEAHGKISFDHQSKANTVVKLEFGEEKSLMFDLEIIDPRGIKIYNERTNYGVLYFNTARDGKFKFRVQNTNKKAIKFSFRIPNVDKELHGAIGPIKDVDIVSELEKVLSESISLQEKHLVKLDSYKSKIGSMMMLLYVFAFFSAVIYVVLNVTVFLKTIKMFESRRKI